MLLTVRWRAVAAALAFFACASPRPQAPVNDSPVVLGLSTVRGQALVDTLFWYTGVRPDSVIVAEGALRFVLPPTAFGHGLRMDAHGCSDTPLAVGAIRGFAAHAWALRDATVTRDTIEVVFAKVTATEQRASALSSDTRSCSVGPATLHLAVADLADHATRPLPPNVR
jgi:hypothetical protein